MATDRKDAITIPAKPIKYHRFGILLIPHCRTKSKPPKSNTGPQTYKGGNAASSWMRLLAEIRAMAVGRWT